MVLLKVKSRKVLEGCGIGRAKVDHLSGFEMHRGHRSFCMNHLPKGAEEYCSAIVEWKDRMTIKMGLTVMTCQDLQAYSNKKMNLGSLDHLSSHRMA